MNSLLSLRLLQIQTDRPSSELAFNHLGDVVLHVPRSDDSDDSVCGGVMRLVEELCDRPTISL